MESEAGQRWLASGNVQAFTKELTKISSEHFDVTMQEARAAGAGADVMVAGVLAEDVAEVHGEAEGAPLVSLQRAGTTNLGVRASAGHRPVDDRSPQLADRGTLRHGLVEGVSRQHPARPG